MENQKPDYYINKKRKIVDFLIGFVMIPVTVWLVFTAYSWLAFTIGLPSWVSLSATLALLVATLVLSVFFKKRRRYIVTGLTAAIIAPFALLLGSCAILPLISSLSK